MPIAEGDRFKHRLTGQLYEVKVIKNGTVILESEDPPYRMWFGDKDVELFFEIAGKGKRKLN
jgi:hypothetical protein